MPTDPLRRSFLGLTAAAAASPALAQMNFTSTVAGRYSVEGRNPDGGGYGGSARVDQQGGTVRVTWQTGGQTFTGTGVIEGRVITVDWGEAHPVVYVTMPNGSLHGTWADGLALDRLSPV